MKDRVTNESLPLSDLSTDELVERFFGTVGVNYELQRQVKEGVFDSLRAAYELHQNGESLKAGELLEAARSKALQFHHQGRLAEPYATAAGIVIEMFERSGDEELTRGIFRRRAIEEVRREQEVAVSGETIEDRLRAQHNVDSFITAYSRIGLIVEEDF